MFQSTNNCVQPGTSQDSSINSGNIPENTFKVKNYYYDNVDVEDGPPPPKRRKLQ